MNGGSDRSGTRDHLVFVHGFMGGAAQWRDQVECFENRFDVTAVDLPGFGDLHDRDAPDSIVGFATYVLDALEHEGISRFHLVGHSMGGMVVQEMVRQAPDRISRLVLYGTGAIGELPGRFETIAESKRRASEDGPMVTGQRISATWFLEEAEAANYGVCEALAKKTRLQAVLAGLTAMETWSGEDNLKNIDCPALVLWGDSDRTYPWSQVERLWRDVPNAQLAVIPGCAHAVHLEKPDIFNAVLGDFLIAGGVVD